MAQLSNLINGLPKYLRNSSERQIYFTKVLKNLEQVKCSSYAAKAISLLCQDLQRHQEDSDECLDDYTNFIIGITKYPFDEKYEKFIIQNLKFFVYFLLNKNANKPLNFFLGEFVIDNIICKDSYRVYFDIVKNVEFYVLQKSLQLQIETDDIKKINKCYNNIAKCMEVPDELEFLDFFEELFNHESSFNTFYKTSHYAKDLVNSCCIKLKQMKNINNLDDFFILVTKIYLSFNKFESHLDTNVMWSMEMLKFVLENQQIKINPYHHYSLTVLYYLNNLRIKNFTQSNLKDIFQKLLKLFESNQNDDWYLDFQLSLIEFFSKNSSILLKEIEIENLDHLIEILYKLVKNFFKMTYSKENCSSCKNYRVHACINIFQILVEIYDKVIKFESNDQVVKFLLLHVFEFIKKYNLKISQCKYVNLILKNKIALLKKIISRITNDKMIKTAVEIVDILNCKFFLQDSQDKIVLLRLYLNLYAKMNEKKIILQLYAALLILMPKVDEDNINSFMFSYIKLAIELDLNDSTFKEILERCEDKFINKEQINEENTKVLNVKLLELIITYKLMTVDKIEHLFEKIIDENSLSTREFIMIARSLEQLKSKKIQKELENKKNILEKCKNDIEKNLLMGHLFKYEALKKFEVSKNSFNFKITSEENLIDINILDFKKINIEKEFEVVEPAIKCLYYFKKVYHFIHVDKNRDCLLNVNAILDDLSYLARNFELRGYWDLAANAWFLVFKFCEEHTEKHLYKMRVVSFFCKTTQFCLDEKFDFILEKEIDSLSDNILQQYKTLETLSPRRQNYVLLCILNIGYFYGYKNDIESFQALIKMVKFKLNELENRKFKCEIVRAHLFSLEFNLRTKINAKLTLSPYMYISQILKELKQIVYITSEDSLNMSSFLIDFLGEISSFLLTILDTKIIISYITYVLSFALQYGITLRISKLITTWIKINIQNGDLFNTQLKLLILEKLLLEKGKDGASIDKYFNEAINKKKAEKKLKTNFKTPVDEARKAFQNNSIVDDSMLYPKHFQHSNFQKYLVDHAELCHCILCKLPIYKFLIFEIGCCYLQMNILKTGDSSIATLFTQDALKWWSKICDDPTKIFYQETLLNLYIDQIKYLRVNEQFSEAIDCCEIASNLIENNKNFFYNNMIWKVIEPYFAIQSNSKTNDIIVMNSPTRKNTNRTRRKIVKV